MPRRTRTEKRLAQESQTVGMQRAERQEQEELAGRKKMAAGSVTKAQRMVRMEEKESELGVAPERIARAGKPLKRP